MKSLMKFANRALEFVIQSNIFIAFAAVIYTVQTTIQLRIETAWHPYLFLIFFATLLEYNAHRLLTILFNKQALAGSKHAWVAKNLRLFYLIVSFSVLGFILASLLAKPAVLAMLFPLGLLTLLYSLPLYKNKHHIFRLREIPFLKIFIISVVWAVSTVMLPVIQSGLEFDNSKLLLTMAERFFFIFAITMPFDIRDMDIDRESGLKTLPMVLGTKRSLQISVCALLLFCMLAILNNPAPVFIAMLLTALGLVICMYSKALRSMHYYHYGLLDGSIIFQSLMVAALQFFN